MKFVYMLAATAGALSLNAADAALAALNLSALPYSNLAYRRAAYQSSAADANRVAHLVTDGSLRGRDARFRAFTARDAEKSPAAEQPEMAFDGDKGTKWLFFGDAAWLQLALPEAAAAASYAITSANDDPPRDPKSWRLLGSDDGERFVELDAQTGQDFAARFDTRVFPLKAARPCRYYRLDILSNHGDKGWNGSGTRLQLAEFDLLDADGKSLVRAGADAARDDYTSAWVSAGARDEWVYVDLGAPSRVDRVALEWCDSGFATDYAVQVSGDAAAWRTVAEKKDGKGGREELSFPAAQATFVRVLCRRTDAARFALAELEVMGENARAPYSTPGGWRVQRASEVSATGEELTAGAYDDSAWLPAVVPGTVLTSYLRAGAIPDMNIADNQRMISDSFFTADFWYRRRFKADAPKDAARLWLDFEAVNWKAEVYLNGKRLGDIAGAFRRKRFDVTGLLDRTGENRLAVRIRRNANPGAPTLQDANGPGGNGGVLGRDNPTIHASIGWDWVPTVRGRNIGIYRDVKVSHSGDVTLSDGWAVTALDVEKGDFSKAEVTLRVRARNASARPVEAVLSGTVEPGGYAVGGAPVALAPGETKEVTVGTFTMANPRLWWPVTYGGQPLYRATLAATVGGKRSDAQSFDFGVRQFTYTAGRPLEIRCNGARIVCRGGNWGMDDANLACAPEDYDTKVRLHAEANLTMIRNWVGMTNSEDFYAACDRYGVLVWDDFWLANPGDGPNPADEAMFLDNAADKLLKVRRHPSVALYCGRNEGDPPKGLADALPRLCESLDGTRHYIPHSAGGTVSGFGPYGVQNPEWYFKNAPDTLHSERGQPNVPEIDSMRAMLGPDHLWPMDDVWGMHDYTRGGAQNCAAFTDYVRRAWGDPKGLEEFTRLAQLVAYENHKAMFESVYVKGGNGILMWMSQSAWPSMVWQTYDYWHDVNGGYYGAKAGNQPVNVILDQAARRFWAVNATASAFEGRARVSFFGADGARLAERAAELALAPDSRRELFAFPEIDPPGGAVIVRAEVRAGERRVAENVTWLNLRAPRDYRALLPLAAGEVEISGVRVARAGRGARGEATVANAGDRPVLLARVKLVDAAGARVLPVHWSENYLTLLPGERRRVSFEAPAAPAGVLRVVQERTRFRDPAALPDWAFGPFVRPEGVNPVIAPDKTSTFDCPMRKRPLKWEESDTFNPAAAVKDGKIVVLYRAEDNTFQGVGSRTSRLVNSGGLPATPFGLAL